MGTPARLTPFFRQEPQAEASVRSPTTCNLCPWQDEAQREADIRTQLQEVNSVFFCDLCKKQYTKVRPRRALQDTHRKHQVFLSTTPEHQECSGDVTETR